MTATLLGCRPAPAPVSAPIAPPAALPAVVAPEVPAGTISLTQFRNTDRDAAAAAGLPERRVRELPTMHRMRRLARSIVRFTHVIYEEDDFAPDDVFVREGWMVLLGEHRGRVIGLTTRCAVDAHQPGYQYLDGNEPGEPELVAGMLALHPPGGGADPRRDAYLVDHETDWSHALVRAPYGRFVDTWMAQAGVEVAAWPGVLERGARVQVRPIGKHDLALVAFEPRRHLGIDGEAAPGGVRVTAVWPGSAAARAGCQVGDVIGAVDDTAVATLAELADACAAAAPGLPVALRVAVGAGAAGADDVVDAPAVVQRTVTFQRIGGFLADGTCDTLGIEAPMESVAALLESLHTVGDLLQTELTAQCVRCRERVQRAQVRGAPSLAEALGRLVPIAGGLLSLDADRAVELAGTLTGVGAVVESVQEWKRLLAGVDDLEAFLQAFPVGDPIALDPRSARALAGDRLVARDVYGVRHELQLAYCTGAPGGRAQLAAILEMAVRERRLLLAVPDGTALDGTRHAHVVVVKPEQWPPTTWRARATLATEGYVNLVCIRNGGCDAVDHGVSDGRATRVILDAFRKLDSLR